MFGAFSGQIGEFKLGKIPERENFDISQLCIAHSLAAQVQPCPRRRFWAEVASRERADAGQTETRPSAADQVLSHQRTVRGFPVCTSRPACNLRGFELAIKNLNANPINSSNTDISTNNKQYTFNPIKEMLHHPKAIQHPKDAFGEL